MTADVELGTGKESIWSRRRGWNVGQLFGIDDQDPGCVSDFHFIYPPANIELGGSLALAELAEFTSTD